MAKVVDECDSTKGCDAGEGYHPPCRVVGMTLLLHLGLFGRFWKSHRACGVPQLTLNGLMQKWEFRSAIISENLNANVKTNYHVA